MIINVEELPEFVQFLRSACGVRQLTTFHPSPNENNEYFRALSEGHMLIAHATETESICVTTDDKYQVILWDRWMKLPREKPQSKSVAETLKQLLLGRKSGPRANARRVDKLPSENLAETLDL